MRGSGLVASGLEIASIDTHGISVIRKVPTDKQGAERVDRLMSMMRRVIAGFFS